MKGLIDLIFLVSISFLIGYIFRNIYPTDRELAVGLLIPSFLALIAYCIKVGIIKFTQDK
ncbi:hypothetical protein HY383_02480 [Candidatus Daviesbacteria bacterium]|nr:hypothetical protein [Candidatus Daviesbacteria bacterium]